MQTVAECHISHSSGQIEAGRQGTVKGEKQDKADNERVGKPTSTNGQAWSFAIPRGQCRTGKTGENCLQIICHAPMTLTVNGLMMMRLL